LLRVAIAVVVLLVVWYAIRAFVSIDTNLLWFRSVQHESAYTRRFWTQALLFAIFGILMAATIAANLIVLHRHRPAYLPDRTKQRWRYRFSRVEPKLRKILFVVIVGYLGITMGTRATGGWQTWLLWRHSESFGRTDPQFHRDISYYVFVYPLHRLVLTYVFRIVATALIVVLVAAYAYGGVRLRGSGPRITPAVRRQVTVLVGCYLVLKAGAYWLDRYALVTSSRGVVTGVGYTDAHAILPGRTVLIVVALLCAALLFANVAFNRGRVLLAGIGLMAFAAFTVGVVWPGLVQRFREKPSASSLELPYIGNNIPATRDAFGLAGDVAVQSTDSEPSLTGAALQAQADRNAQVRLVDPNKVSPTFNVRQQIQGYYGFKSTLDVDRYPVDGTTQDLALAVRELNLSGLPSSRQTWTNTHLVYTHGYGLAAAPTDTVGRNGIPTFVEGDLPSRGAIPLTQQRIYYGQMSPSYSIVGAPPGSTPREFDRPSSNGSGQPIDTTYTGGGGVPIGTLFHRLLYAFKLHSASVLFSSEINSDSQLLSVRNPRSRVAAVAPWLTLDGDTYPTVVNGRIVWVVDGYTTSNNYPDSQQTNVRSATSNTLTQNGATVTQPSTSINYIRNSVKATVDAYTGQVTLYAWNQQAQPDPILKSWEQSFPGLIKPQSDMPSALIPHLRYPQDLFNIQRSLLTRYHVTNATQFYNGSDFWKIPTDPTIAATSRLNAIGKKVKVSAPTQASAYMTLSPDGESAASFALSSPMVTLNLRSLTAFLSVDADPGPGYGHFTLLELPPNQLADSPSQVQNNIESDPKILDQLTLARGGQSRVVLGNLLTIPLGGQMLYIEPVYTRAAGSASFPVLRHVIAIYGNGKPAFEPTLSAALHKALGVKVTLPGLAASPAAANTVGTTSPSG
jgi:uncharacterized membrane protein (UPF0182 family)